ncbi:MAG: hypothetical protein HKN85_12435, partial [Gammaproteobacteria bacterium]|nr:hypothetical protein [Gammaproteobacteria bacterium]
MPINLNAGIAMEKTRTGGQARAKGILLCAAFLILAACSGRDDVVSHDDSADYRNAVSLPPLKKPARQPATAAPAQADSIGDDLPDGMAGGNDGRVGAESSKLSPAENSPADSLNAQIIETKSKAARLQIDGGFEAAWNYVSTRLKGTGITVHNRNQSAGR